MNVNERPCVKGVDARQKFEEGFSKIGFSRKDVKKIIHELLMLQSKGLGSFRNVSKGIEAVYECKVDGFMIIACTSYIWSEERFRDDDQIWVLIIDHRNKVPFYSFPIDRRGDFFTRLFKTAEVYKKRVDQWPLCEKCEEKLFWNMVQSDDFEVIDEQFHNREAVCKKKACEEYMVPKGLVTDYPFLDPKDQKFFARPFKNAQAVRHRNRIKGKGTIPRRWIRYWSKLGIKIPRKPPVYDDLAFEKTQKGKTHFYNEEAIEDLKYYDEGQNQKFTHAD